jgi:L-threonylcarbamoyladenylate synthase
MNTEVIPVNDDSIEKAAALLMAGCVVAFPTETVYGLGANGLNDAAAARIFAAKGRPQDNPLILHVSQKSEAVPLVKRIPEEAMLLMGAFWPGPLTLVLESSSLVPLIVRAGLPSVAVRCPENEWARRLIARCGFPLAAPSANRSGSPSPTTASAVYQDMNGRIPLILDDGPCRIGLESTVLTLCTETPRILRPGGITPEMIERVIGRVEIDNAVLNKIGEREKAASPGMKYRHYAPKAAVTIVDGESAAVAERICALFDCAMGEGRNPAIMARAENIALYGGRATYTLGNYGSAESVGGALFETLRKVDADGCSDVFAEAVESVGFGLAVMNRLLRAAGFHIIHV